MSFSGPPSQHSSSENSGSGNSNVPSTSKNHDTKNHQRNRKKAQRNFLSGILDWLGTLITEQARTDVQVTRNYHVSVYTERHEKVRMSALHIIEDLNEAKKRLIVEFGQSAANFICKCIDPMIAHVSELVTDLSSKHIQDNSAGFLKRAIERVRYYAQLDEGKLKRKIVFDAHDLIRTAIEKDIDMLIKYKKQIYHDDKAQKIDEALSPILVELENLMAQRIDTDDLRAFFSWRNAIDEKRNTLVEMGLYTVDSSGDLSLEGASSSPLVIDDDEVSDFDQIDEEIQEYRLTVGALAILEERLNEFFVLLEQSPEIEGRCQKALDTLLTNLSVEASKFSALHAERSRLGKDFARIQRGLKKARALFEQKRQ